ncbi:G/U mismatch-specific DNA glycosylase [Lentzea flava]|uniref:Mismatch-specific DNA-glycosylase n=1 Tax=Lentzea flava TaxID=103732 RepID=A0ABQ2VAG9_9PSEU|nr:G/U mismatch-specific DNA glycosylase [Lentzea flava]MCP2204309.1 G/U mismatch-specific uracil-DNA glycosylase [Lentzea flava]GGU76295.1 mismatch-specific DNA-glycosylase [Lentzea flava]
MIPDVIKPGLDVLFCGINPGLVSEATGHHFARPGNRFWPALHLSGFTPKLFAPAEQLELLPLGLGITNVVARPSAKADELTIDELKAGAVELTEKVVRYSPKVLAVLGVTVYRAAFGRKKAQVGPQEETVGGARVWLLPNPSGLNAHWQLPALAEEFGRLKASL